MLPANLAKSRAAGAARGLGELLMVSPGTGMLQTLRYSPYSVPQSSNTTAMVALTQHQPALALTNQQSPAVSQLAAMQSAATSPVAAAQGLAQLPQLQLIGLDSNGQISNLSQLLSGQLGGAGVPPPQHGAGAGCKTTALTVPTTAAAAISAASCYSNPFSSVSVGGGAGAGQQHTPAVGLAGLTHAANAQTGLAQLQTANLGYNVSDLLNLHGLHGLQVPVGL